MGFSCRFGYAFSVSIWLIHHLLCWVFFFLKQRTIFYITYFITLLLLDGAIAQGLVLMQICWLQLPEFSLVKLISFLRKEDGIFFFLNRLFSESFLQRHKSVARHCCREQLLWVVVRVSRPSARRWRASDIIVSKKKIQFLAITWSQTRWCFQTFSPWSLFSHVCGFSLCDFRKKTPALCSFKAEN